MKLIAAGLASQKPWNLKACEALVASDWQNLKNLPYWHYFSNVENEWDIGFSNPLPHGFPLGILYRVGPGIYSQGNERKPLAIDADGMVRRFEFTEHGLAFRNRILQTSKLQSEKNSGSFEYPSLSLHPENSWTDSLFNMQNQASVTVYAHGGRLFVGDEIQPATEIDPISLSVKNEAGLDGLDAQYAHTKRRDGKLYTLHLDVMGGGVKVVTFHQDFSNIGTTEVVRLHGASLHDWFVTENYFVFVISSVTPGVIGPLVGSSCLADEMTFDPKLSSRICAVSKVTGDIVVDLPIPAMNSFHGINAYQEENNIIVDFPAENQPILMSDPSSPFRSLMRGDYDLQSPPEGTRYKRFIVDLFNNSVYSGKKLNLEGFELPVINPEYLGKKYQWFYAASGRQFLQSQLVKANVETGEKSLYNFGHQTFVGEPMFVKAVGGKKEDDGFIALETHNSISRENSVVIFHAHNISRGPIWRQNLGVPLPIGFHGAFFSKG